MLFLHRGPLSQSERLGPFIIPLIRSNICEVKGDRSAGKN
jgi:hypothetical protein